jgi:hypothetical protein
MTGAAGVVRNVLTTRLRVKGGFALFLDRAASPPLEEGNRSTLHHFIVCALT